MLTLKNYRASAIFLAACLVLLLLMDRDFNVFDEGFVVSNALRVLHGDIIHRDFYSPYGPGAYYAIAALFKVFGYHVAVERIYAIAVLGALVVIADRVALRMVSPAWAALASGSVFVLLLGSQLYVYPSIPCIALACAATFMLTPGGVRTRPAMLLGAGALCGLAAYFRYETAFFVALANGAGLLSHGLMHRLSVSRVVKAVALYAIGSAAVFLPGASALSLSGFLPGFYHDIIFYPSHFYREMRGLPWPPLLNKGALLGLGAYLPFILAAVGLAEFVWIWRHRRRTDADTTLSFFVLLTTAMLYRSLVRKGLYVSVMALVPGLIVLAVCAGRWYARSRAYRFVGIGLVALTTLVLCAPFAAILHTFRQDRSRFVLGWAATGAGIGRKATDLYDLRCSGPSYMWPARQWIYYGAVTNFIRAHTAPDERIFVGTGRHDKIFVNPVALYASTNRLPATRWHQYDPGVQTRADVQAYMIGELSRFRPRYIVRDLAYDTMNEPNGSSRSGGVYLLDRYLDATYRPIGHSGPVQVWLRRDVAAPGLPSGRCVLDPMGYDSVR